MTEKVALYIRVSTADQVDAGHSLPAQEAALKADAFKRQKSIYKVYCDAGISGSNEDRKGLQALLVDARRGNFSEVLTWKVSRVSRNLSHLLKIIDELNHLGIEFRSLTEQFDARTPIGQFCLTMMGSVAQMQRDAWTESLIIGMERRARCGLSNGLQTLGYKLVPDPTDPRSRTKLQIVPSEAIIVERAFNLYLQGLGFKAIASLLNKEDKQGKNGASFTSASISRLLHNVAYIGKIKFQSHLFDGVHEPIISTETWSAVQERLKIRPRKAAKVIQREYLLSGLLRCPQCGGSMIPTHVKGKRKDGSFRYNFYYSCANYWNKGAAACRANSVRAGDVEDSVLKWVSNALSSPFWAKRIVQTMQERSKTQMMPSQAERKELQDQLIALHDSHRKLLSNYEVGKIDRSTFHQEALLLQASKERLQSYLNDLAQDAPAMINWDPTQIQQACQKFHKILSQASNQQKKGLLRLIIVKIILNEQRQVSSMELKFPLMSSEQVSLPTIPSLSAMESMHKLR